MLLRCTPLDAFLGCSRLGGTCLLGMCALLSMGCAHLEGAHSLMSAPWCPGTCSWHALLFVLLGCARLGGARVLGMSALGHKMRLSERCALLDVMCAPRCAFLVPRCPGACPLGALLGVLLWAWATNLYTRWLNPNFKFRTFFTLSN